MVDKCHRFIGCHIDQQRIDQLFRKYPKKVRTLGNVCGANTMLAQKLGERHLLRLISVKDKNVFHDNGRRCGRLGSMSLNGLWLDIRQQVLLVAVDRGHSQWSEEVGFLCNGAYAV